MDRLIVPKWCKKVRELREFWEYREKQCHNTLQAVTIKKFEMIWVNEYEFNNLVFGIFTKLFVGKEDLQDTLWYATVVTNILNTL